jgi:hypothetical protein
MTKLMRLLSVPVLVLAAAIAFVGVSTVSAQETCDDVVISNTGAGSNNEVTCEGDYQITIECKNDTQIVIDVNQNAGEENEGQGGSGDATVSQNTTGGSAQSGDSVNLSEIDALIENNNCLEEEVAVVTEPEVPTTPEVEQEVEAEPAVEGVATEEAEVLPSTGATTPVQFALLATAIAAIVAVSSKLALAFVSKK